MAIEFEDGVDGNSYVTNRDGYDWLDDDQWWQKFSALSGKRNIASAARATGTDWGETRVCIPVDAENWYNSLKRPFSAREYRIKRQDAEGNDYDIPPVLAVWSLYQIEKCGAFECSVNYRRSSGARPVADGANPSKVVRTVDNGDHACLILEAKWSSASNKDRSLYGFDDDFDINLFRRARRVVSRSNLPRRAITESIETAEILLEIDDVLSDVSELESQSWDPQSWEDLVSEREWGEKDDMTSRYAQVRASQMTALLNYEASCLSPDVPFTTYIVIVARDYMLKYFSSILTPNGMIVHSPRNDGNTWSPE